VTTAQARPGTDERAGYLRGVSKLLWPAPAQAFLSSGSRPAAGPDVTELIVLPGHGRPRLLVPSQRRAGAAAVRGYGEPGSARAQIAASGLALALASGLGARVLRDRLVVRVPPGAQTMQSHLSGVLGQEVLLSMHLGAARANRKPVLQLLAPGGAAVGYAKVGVDELTCDLVRAERLALDRLASARLTAIAVPGVLYSGAWQGLEILVLSPLPVRQRRVALPASGLAAAMEELSRSCGTATSALARSDYWARLLSRLDAIPGSPDQEALRRALTEVAERCGGTALPFGAWHGDWTPWNMASTRGGLLVWDWERFAPDVPIGFDALHCWLQSHVGPVRRDPALAARACVEHAPALLEPFGGRQQAHLTAALYLADLSLRYLADRQEEAGARLGAPGHWLIPALTSAASRL
jgi:hypothetical protein